jgi:predicted secreted Zn-dependent protease
VQLLDQVIRGTPVGASAKTIDGHHELSYDRNADVRHGQCVVHTDAGDIDVEYLIEWLDRDKGQFAVRIPPADLPSCTSPEVVQLLEQMIRGTPVGASAKSIHGHHELSYDRDADVRHGQCVVRTDAGDIDVKYLVEWLDREKGQFAVRIPPPDLPSCTSPEVVRLLEQVIRGTPVGASAKSIDGHRELSYDRDADVRQGQCVVHTDAGDLDVKYLVEWLDRDKGQFMVRTIDD